MGNPADKPVPLRRGDVVLVPFPFTDLTGHKVRPAVIISPDPQHEDVLVAFISSVVPESLQPTDFVVEERHSDFPATGLKRNSVLKANKLLTLHSSLILRRLGHLASDIQSKLDLRLRRAIGLEK